MSLFIHPATKKRLDILSRQLPQSVLLTGELGVGLLTLARTLAGEQLISLLRPKGANGEVDTQSGTISVEMIRGLYEQARSKHTTRQVIIIDNADRMSLGAQAAFLKLLEEPGSKIHFILTSHTPEKLLATVRSRTQQTQVSALTPAQTKDLLKQLKVVDTTKQAQLSFIAEGLPAEITRLTNSDEYFKQRAKIMTDARRILQAEAYDRLLLMQEYQSDRSKTLQLIDAVLLIARRSLSEKPQASLVQQIERLLDIQTNIHANHNIRLQLGRLIL